MRREKRSRKEIRRDLVRNYSTMESKVDSKAKEILPIERWGFFDLMDKITKSVPPVEESRKYIMA